jgi:hypothetical protein
LYPRIEILRSPLPEAAPTGNFDLPQLFEMLKRLMIAEKGKRGDQGGPKRGRKR